MGEGEGGGDAALRKTVTFRTGEHREIKRAKAQMINIHHTYRPFSH